MVVASVDVPAEDEARALLGNRLRQFRRTEVFRISLERSIYIAAGDVRRRVRDEHVEPDWYFREPFDEPILETVASWRSSPAE